VTSRGIEPRSLGLQPSAMTTLARWPEWSRRRESNPRLRLTRAPCFRQHFVDVVQARGFEPRFSGNRPEVLPLDEAWRGPVGWSRTSMVPLKRRGHDRSATTGATNGRVGRTRTSTRLRPRQVGYRLPYDPTSSTDPPAVCPRPPSTWSPVRESNPRERFVGPPSFH
jgi:hypothetical protein